MFTHGTSNTTPVYRPNSEKPLVDNHRFAILKNGWTMLNKNYWVKTFNVYKEIVTLYKDYYREIYYDPGVRNVKFKTLVDHRTGPAAITSTHGDSHYLTYYYNNLGTSQNWAGSGSSSAPQYPNDNTNGIVSMGVQSSMGLSGAASRLIGGFWFKHSSYIGSNTDASASQYKNMYIHPFFNIELTAGDMNWDRSVVNIKIEMHRNIEIPYSWEK